MAPALFADLADAVGRRPAFLAMFAVYLIINLGLALQPTCLVLLALRMLQNLGASATVVASYGLVYRDGRATWGCHRPHHVCRQPGPYSCPVDLGVPCSVARGTGSESFGACSFVVYLISYSSSFSSSKPRVESLVTGPFVLLLGDARCCPYSYRVSVSAVKILVEVISA